MIKKEEKSRGQCWKLHLIHFGVTEAVDDTHMKILMLFVNKKNCSTNDKVIRTPMPLVLCR